MEYICSECGKLITIEGQRIRCPFCGGKVLYKKKPETVITVDVI